MESVRQSCRPKHQVLVLKCYPQYQKGVQDVKPNSSELSYLLYYVSTRRSKLVKVSAFLEKRAARDVWRHKIGNVQVTLQILSALIEKVPRDLPIYARSVMTVIETVLRSHEISIIEDSISTFETFCRHQDMAALSAEQDFANQYREVVRAYAGFADTRKTLAGVTSGPLAIRWRNAGLRAIKGVVSSEAGLAADGGDSLRIILPVILENLYTGDDNLLLSLELKLQEEKKETGLLHRRRVSTATVETVDTVDGDPALAAQSADDVDRQAEMDMRLLALRCLERIVVTGSSRGQIRITTKVLLEFVLSKGAHKSLDTNPEGNWATSLIEVVAKWCPVQIRFIILVAAMELLQGVKPTEETLDRSFSLVYMIDWLLKSPVNMIGLSVIDILHGLMQFMLTLLSRSEVEKSADAEKQNDRSNGYMVLSAKRRELLSLLQRCIGDLTTHIYYGDQVIDMIGTILSRLKPPASYELQGVPSLAAQSDAASSFPGETNTAAFSLPSAKITALKAIKNILLVANSKKFTAAGVESRHQVGIHVWEGTQWFLRDSDRDVCFAYVDAFLTWLNLETTQNDLKIKEGPGKFASSLSRRDLLEMAEISGKRPTNVNQREKAMIVAQLSVLRLLHMTVYDLALEYPTEESVVVILHLLLASLVGHLGINAARFGLPMILRLQADLATVYNLRPSVAKINIGSLVYGYLWALSKKFDLESFRVGSEIRNEIEKRKSDGLWLERIQLPAAGLDKIAQVSEKQAGDGNGMDTDQLTPLRVDVKELVLRIEESYNTSYSHPGSLEHSSALPTLGHISPTENSSKCSLPLCIMEQMLSSWSREVCLATAEKEKAEAISINGSRQGTLGMRHMSVNGGGYSSHSMMNTPTPAQQGITAPAAGLQQFRRMSIPESGTPMNGSSRESPVRVNELKQVLAVNNEGKAGRLSPLRGRLDVSNGSIVSSSSESMVSGFSLLEVEVDGISIRQSSKEGGITPNGDGLETPKASSITLNGGQSQQSLQSDGIPPVPPIPSSLYIPGSFPNDSKRSLSYGDRPSTAPSPRQALANGKPGTHPTQPINKSLSRHKTRSSTGLAATASLDGLQVSRTRPHASGPEGEDPSGSAQRHVVQNLLNGFLSPLHAESRTARARGPYIDRRSATGGIGRPPY